MQMVSIFDFFPLLRQMTHARDHREFRSWDLHEKVFCDVKKNSALGLQHMHDFRRGAPPAQQVSHDPHGPVDVMEKELVARTKVV